MDGNPMSETGGPPSPWWTPSRHADIRPFLAARGAITRAVRAWFDEQGFAEVETGILQVSPGNETHLHAPRTELRSGDGERVSRYLRTSPEFACKKLLAAGETRLIRRRLIEAKEVLAASALPGERRPALQKASSPMPASQSLSQIPQLETR